MSWKARTRISAEPTASWDEDFDVAERTIHVGGSSA
jgi:hypothetical protein